MGRSTSGRKKPQVVEAVKPPSINLLDAREILFTVDGQTFNVEEAPDMAFDQFIRKHLQVCWTLQERVDAINTILADEKSKCSLKPVFPEPAGQPVEA